MKHLLILISSILLFTACAKDDAQEPTGPAQRSLLVFVSAENDLTNYAQDDINEMIQGYRQAADGNDLLIFVDKASYTEMPFIIRINKWSDHPVDTLYKYPTDFYVSNPDNFKEILQRMKQLSPAREYALTFWGHAGGWKIENNRRAYGLDNGNNYPNKVGLWLDIPDMRKVLEDMDTPWKFIFFDCCNMQNIEVAYELRNVTEYIIAAPSEITGVGAPYDIITKDFFITDDQRMYTSLCDDYHAQVTDNTGRLTPAGDRQLPISTIKTSQVQALANATKLLLPELAEYLKTSYATKDIIYYYAYDKNSDCEKVMYDMKDMIRSAFAEKPEKYATWEAVFNQTVVYARAKGKWHGNCVNFGDFTITPEKIGCVSMFFPMEKYNTAKYKYNEDIKLMQWYQAVGWSTVGW